MQDRARGAPLENLLRAMLSKAPDQRPDAGLWRRAPGPGAGDAAGMLRNDDPAEPARHQATLQH
jgi:hypothetical protein